MEINWISEENRPKWVLYVREDYQHIDTNNLLEPWFNTLKNHHLERKRGLRADSIVYMLEGVFRTQNIKVHQGIQLSKYDKKRKAKAMALDFAVAQGMVTENIADSKDVQSAGR
ncbi:hypothetical protein BGZ65_008718, partial [Modicella reniformis]